MINYTVFNLSTVVNSTNLQNMVRAINIYLTTVCNDWGLASTQLVIGNYNSHMSLQNDSIFIYDNTDQEGALGYHYETNGNAVGRVFAETLLNYGGVILYQNSTTFTVAQCLAHELLEMIGNPETNKWYLDNYGNLWAGELCDPVESNLIVYTLPGNIKVGLSNYVLPKWFSPDSISGPYDKLGVTSYPFEIASGGYAIVVEDVSGDVVSLYGMNEFTQSTINGYKMTNNSMIYNYGSSSIVYGVGTFSSDNKLLTYQSYEKTINPNKRGVVISKRVK